MRHDAIVDKRLLVRLDLDHSLKANSFFMTDPLNRSHFANQLLLYDTIIAPTKDFAIIPILISWLGLGLAADLLEERSLQFLHYPSMLSYVGNGVGISALLVKPSQERPFEWWQVALFGDASEAIGAQLRNMCPFVARRRRDQLISQVLARTHVLQYDNEAFMRHIVHETYTDIMKDLELNVTAMVLAGNPEKLILQNLPDVDQRSVIVPTRGPINNAAQLILRVADTNMSLFAASKVGDADVMAPSGADKLLRGKLIRSGATPSAADNFLSILDLTGIPDPGAAVASGDVPSPTLSRFGADG